MEIWLIAYGNYREDWELIGPFSSRELAEEAIADRQGTTEEYQYYFDGENYHGPWYVQSRYPEDHTLLRGTLDSGEQMEEIER